MLQHHANIYSFRNDDLCRKMLSLYMCLCFFVSVYVLFIFPYCLSVDDFVIFKTALSMNQFKELAK